MSLTNQQQRESNCSGGEAIPEHKKPLAPLGEELFAREITVPFGASASVASHGLARKCTYQPTLAYSRRLP